MVVLTEISEQSSSSSSSSTSSTYDYDVFLNFRGADTRNNFTDYLLKALREASIRTFFDDDEIRIGDSLKPELENAIKSSRASVIVLSKNYASSRWCLDELALIMEQRRTSKHIVCPIFYHVNPSDVRKQLNTFGDAMAEYKRRMQEAESDAEKRNEWAYKIEKWKKALTEVADLRGEEANDRPETTLIQGIITKISSRLDPYKRSKLPHMIELESSIRIVTSSTYDYGVFLSFRGADTRNNFTDHLLKALREASIRTFFDDAEIQVGDSLKPELENAIKSSRASIIVLSKNYVSSRWCLDELALIMEQRRTSKHIVYPIFYNVKPSDVRKQRNNFGDAMAKHEQRMEAEASEEKRSELGKKIEKWKKALTEVADMKGKEANGRETKLIEEIVKDISSRLELHKRSEIPKLNSTMQSPLLLPTSTTAFAAAFLLGVGITAVLNLQPPKPLISFRR